MSAGPAELERARVRYLELLKRSLLGQTNFDNELRIHYLRRCAEGGAVFDAESLHAIRQAIPEASEKLAAAIEAGFPDADLDRLPFCYTLVGRKRLEHIEQCVRTLLDEGVAGDLVECGVWRGGAVVFMRGLLAAYEASDRAVWVADSFEGLPPPVLQPDVALGVDLSQHAPLAVDLDTVQRAFSAHGLLDGQVRFLRGWFADTLPGAPVDRVALLRVDGDLYSSTLDALNGLYDRVVPGGFVVVDDTFLPCCRQAVDEFLAARRISVPVQPIDWTGICWRKPG